MFKAIVKGALSAVYFLLIVIAVLVIYFALMLLAGEEINVPIFAFVLFTGVINLVVLFLLKKYLRNLSLGGFSSNEQYKDIQNQIKAVESQILKGFAHMTFEESKKQMEEQYRQVMGKKTPPVVETIEEATFEPTVEPMVEHELFPETKVEEVNAEPIIETVDAEFFEEDDSFAEFDYTLEEYAHIAVNAMQNEWQEGLQEDFDPEEMPMDIDLNKMTVPELKDMCKQNDIKGYSTMRKAELIEALRLVLNSQD